MALTTSCRPFEQRFIVEPPPPSGAQEAATRVYNRDGILIRSDPFVKAADRHGNPFPKTKWHDSNLPPPQTGPRPPMDPPRPQDPLSKFKQKILERMGSGGIVALGRIFRVMDDDRSRTIDAEELRTGLGNYGLHMTKDEITTLIKLVGKGKPVTYNEMLVAVRGDINKRRMQLIEQAFKIMDRTGDGKVTVEDLEGRFNVDHHPDVLLGRIEPRDGFVNFLSNFDGVDQDGCVTKNEFIDYYRAVSASIDLDDYFELMMRNAWHIPGGSGQFENTANTRLLVVLGDGSQKVVTIKDDLGLDFNDWVAVMSHLEAQGLRNVVRFTRSAVI